MFGALAMMLPDRVKAAGDGGNTGISIGGYDLQRKPFVYVDFTCGAWGARPWADGLDGNSHMFANMASHSIEVTEAEHPIQLTAYEFVPDKAGPEIPLRPRQTEDRFRSRHEGSFIGSDRRELTGLSAFTSAVLSGRQALSQSGYRYLCCPQAHLTSNAATFSPWVRARAAGRSLDRDPAALCATAQRFFHRGSRSRDYA